MLRKMLYTSVLLLLLAACSSGADTEAAADTEVSTDTETAAKVPVRILIIGDSYVENHGGMAIRLQGLARAKEPPIPVQGRNLAEPGASLSRHWDNGEALTMIQEQGPWDYIVLQSDLALEPRVDGKADTDRFFEHIRLFHEAIQEAGAETILLMHWANPMNNLEDIAAAHYEIAEELGIEVAPVGLAWKNAREQNPDLNLYAPDNRHANLEGEYLTISVLYGTIFDETPEGISYFPADIYRGGTISEEDADFLATVAWETLKENQ